jgi:glycosyltransferase involved in cell wall biosynthesis
LDEKDKKRLLMKILTLGNVPLDSFLGSGKKRLAWRDGLRARGHQVDTFEPKHFEIGYTHLRKAKKFRQTLGAWLFFKNYKMWKQYDLIEFNGDEFWLVMNQLKKEKNRPLIVASTDGLELLANERSLNYEVYEGLGKLRKWWDIQTHHRLSWIAFKSADALVSVCELDRYYAIEHRLYDPDMTAVVPNCIDCEYHMPFIQQRENRVAFTGTWISRKGVRFVVDVMTQALKTFSDLQFDIFGTGGKEFDVKNDFSADLRTRIHVHGKLSNEDLASQLSRAKIFFLPSQYEGFGIATAEAMGCGCAVITTPTGLGWELKNGEEAIICDFNDVEGMKRAMCDLLINDALRIEIAKKGWERSHAFYWDKSLMILEKTYKNWIDKHR